MHCKFGVRIVIQIQIKYPWQIIDLIPIDHEVSSHTRQKIFLAGIMDLPTMKHCLEQGNALRFHDHV